MLTKTNQQGFTLIELLTVIALFMFLASFSLPIFGNFQASTEIKSSEEQIIQLIRLSQNRACSGVQDSNYGIYFDIDPDINDKIILFSGDSYGTRNSTFDEETILERIVSLETNFTNNEIVFTKNDCQSTESGTVTINVKNIPNTKTISVNSLGIVN